MNTTTAATIHYPAADTIDGVPFTVSAETMAALIEDARQVEADFLAAIAADDAAAARRARHDLRPGQRLGNR